MGLSEKAKAYIAEYQAGISRKELCARMAREIGEEYPVLLVKGYCCRQKLQNGLHGGRFEKGHVPYNKGKPTLCHENIRKHCYAKGNRPHNTLPVGSVVKDKQGYWKIKTGEPRRWEYLNRLLWRERYGEIPEGHSILFLDGDKNHLKIENLCCVSRAELVRINQNRVMEKPKAIRPVAVTLCRLAQQCHERKKAGAGKEG